MNVPPLLEVGILSVMKKMLHNILTLVCCGEAEPGPTLNPVVVYFCLAGVAGSRSA